MAVWFIDDLNEHEIWITDTVRNFYIPKFTIDRNYQIEGDVLYLRWNDRASGDGGDERTLPLNYLDVVDGYSGYISNPTSAIDLRNQIQAMIVSAWTNIVPGDVLTAKADLLSHDGVSDTILPGGTNEYILSRDNGQSTGLNWIPKTNIYSDAMAIAAVGKYSYLIGYNDNVTTTNTVAQEYICGVLIPGGTLAVGDLIVCKWGIKKTSGVGSMQGWAHLHTAAAIGGNFYGTGTLGATQGYQGEANILITGAATQRGSAGAIAVYGTAFAADFTTSALNIANDMYVNILTQKSVGTDGGFVRYQTVEIIKKR